MKHQNARAAAFYQLPETLRLAVVARLHEQRQRASESRTRLKTTVKADADLLGLNVSVVERHQKKARQVQIIRTTYDYAKGGPDQAGPADQFIEHLRRASAPDDRLLASLRARPGSRLKSLQIAHCGGPHPVERRLHIFGEIAGPMLPGLLRSARSLGVTWGHTLLYAIQACDRKSLAPEAKIFPLTGETPETAKQPWTSSQLVAAIAARRCRPARPPSLKGVWPAVHKDLPKDTLIASMMASPAYEKIFGDAGLVPTMDAVLTSIGRKRLPWGMGPDALTKLVGISRVELNALSPGDIGGVLIPRSAPPLSPAEQREFDKVQDSWIGLTSDHLKNVVKKAADSDAPGVCVLASGRDKASLLINVIERGLVSQVIVDELLADELMSLLKLPRKRLAAAA